MCAHDSVLGIDVIIELEQAFVVPERQKVFNALLVLARTKQAA